VAPFSNSPTRPAVSWRGPGRRPGPAGALPAAPRARRRGRTGIGRPGVARWRRSRGRRRANCRRPSGAGSARTACRRAGRASAPPRCVRAMTAACRSAGRGSFAAASARTRPASAPGTRPRAARASPAVRASSWRAAAPNCRAAASVPWAASSWIARILASASPDWRAAPESEQPLVPVPAMAAATSAASVRVRMFMAICSPQDTPACGKSTCVLPGNRPCRPGYTGSSPAAPGADAGCIPTRSVPPNQKKSKPICPVLRQLWGGWHGHLMLGNRAHRRPCTVTQAPRGRATLKKR